MNGQHVQPQTPRTLTEPQSRFRPAFLFLCALGVALRLIAAQAGDNYDMQSWWIASEAFNQGESIYSATHRYNYGPIWFYVLGGLRYLSAITGDDTITRLHFFIASFLSLVDIALASFILRRTSKMGLAGLFLLNPISILVTGYHIQFDNLAILLGLLAWEVLSTGNDARSIMLSGLLLGTSLTTKHIFSIFLAWLPFLTLLRSLSQRLICGALALALFIGSFTPWLSDPASLQGVVAHVLRYTSTEGHSLTSYVSSFVSVIPQRTLFVLLLAICGTLLVRSRAAQTASPFIYLTLLTALSSGMARNYLAIPLVTLVMCSSCVTTWLYFCVATLALITVNTGLGVTEVALPVTTWSFVSYELLQLLLVAFLLEALRRRLYV